MRLGFHYHVPGYWTDGALTTASYLGVFLDELAAHVEHLVCFLHRPTHSEIGDMDYVLRARNVSLFDLGPHDGIPLRMLRAMVWRRNAAVALRDVDVVLLRAPTPLVSAFASLCRTGGTRLGLLVVGDYVKSFDGVDWLPWWKSYLLGRYYRWNRASQARATRGALLIANNPDAFEEYAPRALAAREIATSTLRASDLAVVRDTCVGGTLRMLCSGRIVPEKGIADAIDALGLLRGQGLSVQLDVVGWDPTNDQRTLEMLVARAHKRGLSEHFRYLGRRSVGPDLWSVYRGADVFLAASRGNEGFPRCIWEALGHALPTVATRVGTVDRRLRDGAQALLVPPGDPVRLAAAVSKLASDAGLRARLIREGLALARTVTLEHQVAEMVSFLRD